MTSAQTSETQFIRRPACGVTNRVTPEKLEQGRRPVCGRCKTALPVSNKPVAVTDATFPAEVERSPLPVLLDMWADWCGPCHMMAPVLDQLAAERAGRERFNVRSLPTLLVLKAGREVARIVGVQPKSEITRQVALALA